MEHIRFNIITRGPKYTQEDHAGSCVGAKAIICVIVCIQSLVTSLPIQAQTSLTSDIPAILNAYAFAGIQEKIYVHTDKNYYLTGEILWLKLYYTNAVSNKPINLSKVAYIEILDSANTPVCQVKTGLYQGEGNASVHLPPGIASGYYKLRAYTNWMKNFAPDYFFEKEITILNLNKFPTVNKDPASKNIDVQFFPEGGELVNGIKSKVGFKAVDHSGKGVPINGLLLENSDTLLRFSATHAGMGNFSFTPRPGYTYSAILISPIVAPFKKNLPAIRQEGVVMSLSKSPGGNLDVTAFTNDDKLKQLQLLAHTRSSVKISRVAPVISGRAIFSFKESDLGEGVSQLTIFGSDKIPLCERLYFRRPQKDLGLSISANHASYEKRSEISISLSSQQLQGTDTAKLSMSVYLLDSLQDIDNNNILHYLYLSSDLKGLVEDPSYYFTDTKEAEAAADNLMLTQGWRRFKWSDVLAGKKPRFDYPPEIRGHFITGRVTHSLTGQPAAQVGTYIGSPADLTQFGSAVSHADGTVKYEMNNLIGGNTIIAQTNPLTQDSIFKIHINSPFSHEYTSALARPFIRPVQYPNTLLKQSVAVQVQTMYVPDKMNRFVYPPNTDTASFYVKPDFRYELESYTRFTSMEEILREYVVLVNVRRRNGQVELPIVDPVAQRYLPGRPLNLLDGVPVFDFTKFFEFDPLKLRLLEVVGQRYIYGPMVFDGILNWKTYKPALGNYHLSSNATVVEYEGLQAEREFYSPVYNSPENRASHLPDYRTVLFWTPNLTLTGNKSTSSVFYTSDLTGKFAVIVEGLSKQGVAGGAVTTLEVK
jgi:hypothetical protein